LWKARNRASGDGGGRDFLQLDMRQPANLMISRNVTLTLRHLSLGASQRQRGSASPLSPEMLWHCIIAECVRLSIMPGPTATKLFLDGKPQAVIDHLAKLAPLERLGQPRDHRRCRRVPRRAGWLVDQWRDLACQRRDHLISTERFARRAAALRGGGPTGGMAPIVAAGRASHLPPLVDPSGVARSGCQNQQCLAGFVLTNASEAALARCVSAVLAVPRHRHGVAGTGIGPTALCLGTLCSNSV
jgi:hypothetical protein